MTKAKKMAKTRSIIIGSSILGQMKTKFSALEGLQVVSVNGGKLDFKQYIKSLYPFQMTVTCVYLIFLGGNNIFRGKIEHEIGAPVKHYHSRQKCFKTKKDLERDLMAKYRDFIDSLFQFFPNLESVSVTPPLPRRCLNNVRIGYSTICSDCVNLTDSFSTVVSIFKKLMSEYAERENVVVLNPFHMFTFFAGQEGISGKKATKNGKSYHFWEKIMAKSLSEDHIHLNEFGIDLFSSYIFTKLK